MAENGHQPHAFTLVEMMVAMTILGVALTLAMTSWLHVLVGQTRVSAQNELDMDARTSMERLRADIRISDLNSMVYYPAGVGPYTGISFPVAVASSTTNLLDNGGSNVVWNRTVVYHVFTSSPNELKRTVFLNRNLTATVSNRQSQLNQVVADGHGRNACLNGETTTTSLLFQNLFSWQITPNTVQFDCYASSLMRDRFLFGAAYLGPGSHTVEFRVVGKNPAGTSNRWVGVDLLNCSVSGSDQEAEDATSSALGGSPTIAKTYMPNGSWSGNYQLQAKCTTTQGVSVTVQNDCWKEGNFQTYGGLSDNTYLDFDKTLTPWYHYVMRLDGATGLVWKAGGTGIMADPQSQCYDSTHDNIQPTPTNVCMRVFISGAYILQNGKGPILVFSKCSDNPVLVNPTIALANTTNNIFTCDAVTGSVQNLVFYQNGQTQSWANCTYNSSGADVYAMPATPINIYSNQSYLVSYYAQDVGGGHNMYHNEDSRFTNGCYLLTNCSSAYTTNACWSTNACLTTDLAYNFASNGPPGKIYSLYQMASGFVTNGTYTSAIFDSGQSVATTKTIAWSNSVPSNTWFKLYARTGNQSDLSDATAWTNLPALTTASAFSNNTGRYLQFRASMGTTPFLSPNPYPPSPRLIWVSFSWNGDTKIIDTTGILTRGPDYAQCQVMIDGKPLTRSIKVDLTIFKYVRRISGGSNEQFTSFVTQEIQPRNTGM